MSVFDNSLDSISILFIILHSLHFIVSIFIVIFVIFRIIAEFNDPFINKLKLIQNSTILIWFSWYIIKEPFEVIFPELIDNWQYLILDDIFDWSLLYRIILINKKTITLYKIKFMFINLTFEFESDASHTNWMNLTSVELLASSSCGYQI